MTIWVQFVVIFAAIFGSNLACKFVEPKQMGNATVNLDTYLSKYYDKSSKPECDKKTVVSVDIYILSFDKIEEANMEFTVYMYFRQTWKDPRLAGLVDNTTVLSRKHILSLWLPDTFCSNAKISNLMTPDSELHSALILFPNGDIFYSRGAHVTASCHMNLRDFPMDTQNCALKFESYGYINAEVDLVWTSNSTDVDNREMAQFSVSNVILSRDKIRYTRGNYTILQAMFVLDRRVGYYVIQVYVPCVLLVMLSWIVFWMGIEETGNRLTVGITTILTIVFLLGYTNASLPKVSYVKGMDMYLMVSFLFIFLSLIECIVVDKCCKLSKGYSKKSSRKKRKRKTGLFNKSIENDNPNISLKDVQRNQSTHAIKENGNMSSSTAGKNEHPTGTTAQAHHLESWVDVENEPTEVEHSITSSSKCCNQKKWTDISLATKVDKISRSLFPFLFLVYNIVYWFTYLNHVQILPH